MKMAIFFAERVVSKKTKLEDVPTALKEKVIYILKQNNYIE